MIIKSLILIIFYRKDNLIKFNEFSIKFQFIKKKQINYKIQKQHTSCSFPMISAVSFSRQKNKIENTNDNKSRQYLSALLDHQIDRNQILEADNKRLQEQQRKLLDLLQIRTQQLKRLKNINIPRKIQNTQKQKIQIVNDQQKNNSIQINYEQYQKEGDSNKKSQKKQQNQFIERQKNTHNDSTGLFNNNSINDTNNQNFINTISSLKNSLNEKQEEMIKMRDYYNRGVQKLEKDLEKAREKYEKQYHQQIQEYRTVIAKQKARVKQLMDALEKLQQEKAQLLQKIQYNNNKLIQNNDKQSRQQQLYKVQVQKLQKKLREAQQRHLTQITGIQQAHQEQKQQILQAHTKELQKLHQNTIFKIQKTEQKSQKQINQLHKQLQNQARQLQKMQKQQIKLQERLKQQLIKYEEQCQIVLSIESVREKLQNKIRLIQGKKQQQKQQKILQMRQKNTINIDNIHKQYNSKLQDKSQEILNLRRQLQQISQKLSQKQAKHQKIQEKLQQNIKKSHQKTYLLEVQLTKCKQQFSNMQQQNRYLQKQLKLKQQDIKRLTTKIGKDTEKREQYIKKLQERIESLQEQLNNAESIGLEKQADILKYKQQMTVFIQKLKEQLGKKQREAQKIQHQQAKRQKQQKQKDQKIQINFAHLNNQLQDTNKKYSHICQRLKIVEQQRNNYKSVYDDAVKEIKVLQNKQIRSKQQTGRYKQRIEQLQKQIQILKEQILSNNLTTSQKQQFDVLKNQNLQCKARIIKLNEINNKIKQQNSRIMKENLQLQDNITSIQSQNIRLNNQLQLKKQDIQENQHIISDLRKDLQLRKKQLETSMPYINKVLEEKKHNELQLQRKNNQIKKLMSLVQMAKKSKAEQIINFKSELQSKAAQINQLESQVKDNRDVIQRFNREKVNMLRQNTVREDLLKKLERQNKQLKEGLKQSQNNVDQLMHYIGIADTAMESVELQQSFTKKSYKKF